MDQAITQVIVAGVVELVALPVMIFIIKRSIGKRLDKFDEKRDEARVERAEAERVKIEQREAERGIVLAIARTMLLDNYEKCMDKGYYTLEERTVYGSLFRNYVSDGGNGIIEELAPRLRALPIEPPDGHYEEHEGS